MRELHEPVQREELEEWRQKLFRGVKVWYSVSTMRVLFLFLLCFSLPVLARQRPRFEIELQPGVAWQSRNEFSIPTVGGTRVRLTDFGPRGTFTLRGYGVWNINDRHSLRLLIAPFTSRLSFTPAAPISFNGQNFAASTPLEATYKFNSYRLTYFYRFPSESAWRFRLGFTAKIRDALIGLSDGTTSSENVNVGFVPLLHFGAVWFPSPDWHLELDLDGLAAPQGRAFDVALSVGYTVNDFTFQAGYRTVEGGAENDRVFTFAWLHSAFVGIKWSLGALGSHSLNLNESSL
ncbi:MAG: hypothetical protein H6617_10210 [Bdellovibrionaceae bacterium]|nr:hypothetical protein [Bdellovibrionales bacterium]MCB9255044.1 hypothetical protein [Pseudobdellovibrionaceae bacterium]